MPTHLPDADHPRGIALLRDPLLNKGTAFTEAERDALCLRGLLPACTLSIEEQADRVLENLRRLPDDLEKYVALNALHDRNETLFFRVLSDNIDEIQPLVYTPTVGLACQRFGHIFQRPRGLFISANDRGRIVTLLRNWPHPAKLIVVTDGERILGLGDLGANGMGIPVGKLALYSACAGVHPKLCLPVMLDVGTNNEELLQDPYYIGLRRHRLDGPEYDEFVDEFISAACDVFPGVLIQFEDSANHAAFQPLRKYRDRAVSSTTTSREPSRGTCRHLLGVANDRGALVDQKLLFARAGEAATGIADLMVSALIAQGCSDAAARHRLWLTDLRRGLVVAGIATTSPSTSSPMRTSTRRSGTSCTANPVREADRNHRRSGIWWRVHLPKCWSDGASHRAADRVRALEPYFEIRMHREEAYRTPADARLFACGSPYDPVQLNRRTFVPRQGNNSDIFPGVGLGAIVSGARRITDGDVHERGPDARPAGHQRDLEQGSLYPASTQIRDVSATSLPRLRAAYTHRFAAEKAPDDVLAYIQSKMYEPRYVSYAWD